MSLLSRMPFAEGSYLSVSSTEDLWRARAVCDNLRLAVCYAPALTRRDETKKGAGPSGNRRAENRENEIIRPRFRAVRPISISVLVPS